MRWKLATLSVLFLTFLLYTAWVAITREQPLLEYLLALRANAWNTQILVDLAIALTLVCTWLVRDAWLRGRRAWPWVLATPIFGSLSPLLYLALRELRQDPTARTETEPP